VAGGSPVRQGPVSAVLVVESGRRATGRSEPAGDAVVLANLLLEVLTEVGVCDGGQQGLSKEYSDDSVTQGTFDFKYLKFLGS
jgi:hypothetical protein